MQNDGIDVGAGEQVGNVRVLLGYGNSVIRGQVQVLGGILPAGIRLTARVRRVSSGRNLDSVGIDPRVDGINPG